jgi:hypothetical protein
MVVAWKVQLRDLPRRVRWVQGTRRARSRGRPRWVGPGRKRARPRYREGALRFGIPKAPHEGKTRRGLARGPRGTDLDLPNGFYRHFRCVPLVRSRSHHPPRPLRASPPHPSPRMSGRLCEVRVRLNPSRIHRGAPRDPRLRRCPSRATSPACAHRNGSVRVVRATRDGLCVGTVQTTTTFQVFGVVFLFTRSGRGGNWKAGNFGGGRFSVFRNSARLEMPRTRRDRLLIASGAHWKYRENRDFVRFAPEKP